MTARSDLVDEELILRMAKPGPRYTSYPTAPEWSDEFGEADARAALQRASVRTEEPLSLYVHLPFCERRCLFCGCTVEITRNYDRVERYLDALDVEIGRVAELLGERRGVLQLHLGGGTPTHLDPGQLRRLYGMIASRFEVADDAEVSIEVHPHVTTHEQIDTLAELGFNRVSMGVQDLDERVQEVVHRFQTTAETEDLVAHCRTRGIGGINLDLMYGLPEQTEATFSKTIDTIARMRPDRLAVYAYAHVPWLKKTQTVLEQYAMPDPALRARLFSRGIDQLAEVGYEVIGLDHFALPSDSLHQALGNGTLHRNFMGYTTYPAAEMVSFGMSAIGDAGGSFLQNARTTKEWHELVEGGGLATVRGMRRSAEDDLRREVIQSLMCRMHLDLDEIESRFGPVDFTKEWRELEPLAEEGLCTISERRVEVLPRGRIFLRHLAMVFDAYLTKKRADGPRFSQTL